MTRRPRLTSAPVRFTEDVERELRELLERKHFPYTDGEQHNDHQRERKWEWDERKYLDRIWPGDPL